MQTAPRRAKRKYSIVLFASCPSLLLLYYVYWIPYFWASLSGAPFSLENPKPSEAEDHVALKTQAQEASRKPSPGSETTSALLTLSPEYSTLSESQRKCQLFFTPSYLEHIAIHQQPYCEEPSPSAFQCFVAPRLVIPITSYWGQTDPLCVAQGVSFRPGLAGNQQDSGASGCSYSSIVFRAGITNYHTRRGVQPSMQAEGSSKRESQLRSGRQAARRLPRPSHRLGGGWVLLGRHRRERVTEDMAL